MFTRIVANRSVANNVRWTSDVIIPVDSAIAERQEVMLQLNDYPLPFRGRERGTKIYAHPDDYKKSDKWIKPRLFLYKGAGGRGRLFLRTSLRLSKATDKSPLFTNATFFVDSGACPELTLCKELNDLLSPRIVQHFEYDFMETKIGDKNHRFVVSTSLDERHKPANLMGLPVFFALGFNFKTCDIRDLPQDEHRIVKDVVTIESFDFL